MARHHEAGYVHTAQQGSISNGLNLGGDKITISDDEAASDVDEPPDERIYFSRHSPNGPYMPRFRNDYVTNLPKHQIRKPSLLTQALLKNPDPTPSESEAPLLTSDGDMTSPTRTNTPSPPLPDIKDTGIGLNPIRDCSKGTEAAGLRLSQSPSQKEAEILKPCSVEVGLGRPRRITFACGGKKPSNPSDCISIGVVPDPAQTADPPKRSCKLRFACPIKPSCTTSRNEEVGIKRSSDRVDPIRPNAPPSTISLIAPESRPQHRDLASTITKANQSNASQAIEIDQTINHFARRKKLKRSEATRFHEFASSFDVEDDWIQEQPPQQEKITVQDTLRKENLIRRLAEEADEEALEDELVQKNESYDNTNRLRLDDEDLESEYGSSDGGNETDDEEGFAASDDDSDHGSQYQFWNSGLTTAATSSDHIEHFRPRTHRVASESSIESMINTLEQPSCQEQSKKRNQKNRHRPRPPKMRPGTPDLPDSTDFVCGTLDEDRPIEAAYMSCLEERRRSRHKTIPQDIDPSFPTSDLDEEDDDDDEDDAATQASDDHLWVTGRPDNSDEDHPMSPRKGISRVRGKSPMPSPKRPRSPAPPRRGLILRSPPPRCLFGRSPVHNRPLYMHQKLKSPPSTRRASITLSPLRGDRQLMSAHLAQRPYLTHTTSLPRTPNPFWRQHRDFHIDGSDEARSMAGSPKIARTDGRNIYRRGPINIVRGLENKRRWRRERLCRQQVRHTGKEKERRCQPGKGAERMRELGLEMAGKGRGYCHRAELVLSL